MILCRVSYPGLPAVVMGCSCRLMLALVLLFALPTQGHEACYNDSWTYHSHTHSCLRLYRLPKTWTQARDYCSEIQLGRVYGVITRLVKIDDKKTDIFTRSLFPGSGWIAWIGLYYNTDKGAFRWDGYPDEVPKYTDTNWRGQSSLPYVSSSLETGRWEGRVSDQTHHLVCQHSAKKIGIVTCEQQVKADGLEITCTSLKSPIKAKCEWTHKYDGDTHFRKWRSMGSSSHDSHIENPGGNVHYITTCSMTLSKVNAGTFMFKMKMYPDISGPDISANEEALTVGRLNNTIIEEPDKPQFKLLDNTVQASSPIHFHDNDKIHITCEVQSGNLPVHSVTLSCEFPFNDSDEDNKHTVSGSTYVMVEMASSYMDGKNCTCIGNHLTGPIESSPLTFNVTYPAKVKNFTVNGSTPSVPVNMNETLTLSCTADGNPLPSVNIRQVEPSHVDTSTWQSDKLGRKLEKKIVARCAHNGRYACSASNIHTENNEEVTNYVDIRVRCPPTYCNKMSEDLKLVVKPFQTVSLCVLAYPMPAFKLLKNSKAGWNTTEDLSGQINNVTKFESQQNVTINFSALGPSHLGQYALDYSVGSSVTSSRLYFQLTAPLTPCGEDENLVQEVTIGQSVSINMCVTAYPKPSKLVMQIEHNEFGWRDYDNANITMVDDFDTLTEVTVDFSEVKATDLGKYRLYDPQDAKGPHLTLSLSEARSGGSEGVSGAIVGAVVSIMIVIIIVVVIVIFIVRRRRNRDKQNENLDSNKDSDTATYSNNDGYNNQEDVSVKRKRAKTGVEVPIYDNDGYAFEHRCSKDYVDEKETVDTERPYSNTDVQNNTPDIKESDSNTAKEEDDLVYITLDFNCTTDKKAKTQKKSKPQSKSKKAKAEKEQKEKEQEQEQTEYAAISATATIKIKMEKENDKNKEKDGGDEEDVYENTKAEDNVP